MIPLQRKKKKQVSFGKINYIFFENKKGKKVFDIYHRENPPNIRVVNHPGTKKKRESDESA